VLAQAIRKLAPFDLILCGERATDGDTGQVGPGIAAWLDLPFATYISAIKETTAKELIIERMVETGYEKLAIELPCLLTVVKELNYPRLPTLKGKIASRNMTLPIWGPEEIEAKPENLGLKGSPTRVVKIASPQVARFGEVIKPKDEHELEETVDGLLVYMENNSII
jgi:electron transfer flavoprotein beta subunit